MARLVALLSSTLLCVCLGIAATGCGRTPEAEKKNPDKETTDSKKPEIILHAKDLDIEVEIDQSDVNDVRTKEPAKGVVTISAERKNMKEEEEIAVTFSPFTNDVTIENTKVKPKETEATTTISVPKGQTIGVKTPHSEFVSRDIGVIVTGTAGELRTQTTFKVRLKAKGKEKQ